MLGSDRYAELRSAGRVREPSLFAAQRTPPEIELQARWFAGDFGNQFRSTTGEQIEVLQFGVWNREAGPDFVDAAIRIDGAEDRRGSIEFDLTNGSWETHAHSTNPAFDDTVLHVFVFQQGREFFTRTSQHRNVPQVRVDLSALPENLNAFVPLAKAGRCHAPLRDIADERVNSILDAAAQFRLRRKSARLQQIAEHHGRDEALFQEIAGALGYKQNKLPFTLLAQRLPLRFLRERVDDAECLLFGAAGFLEAADPGEYEQTTRGYLRTLWDRWWQYRDATQRLVLPLKIWKVTGTRPANHPQRRLAALAALVREWPRFLHALDSISQRTLRQFFATLEHPYWNSHYTLTSPETDQPMALIGATRVAEIQANVIFPEWLRGSADVWTDYRELRAKLTNRRIETAAARLFGEDSRRATFLKTVAHQQGLLQIYEDFCMQDSSDCARCPFPEQMQKWK